MRGYDYDFEQRRRRAAIPPAGWYPGAFWAGSPVYGWDGLGGSWGWPSYLPMLPYGDNPDFQPRRPPRESRTYGRGGDEAVRRWARGHGYDEGYEIQPRERPRRGYDRGW